MSISEDTSKFEVGRQMTIKRNGRVETGWAISGVKFDDEDSRVTVRKDMKNGDMVFKTFSKTMAPNDYQEFLDMNK